MQLRTIILILIFIVAASVFADQDTSVVEVDVQLAQIEVRPRPFLCLINYYGRKDKCDVNRPVSSVNEVCQCNYNGELVNGVVIPNPSYEWSR